MRRLLLPVVLVMVSGVACGGASPNQETAAPEPIASVAASTLVTTATSSQTAPPTLATSAATIPGPAYELLERSADVSAIALLDRGVAPRELLANHWEGGSTTASEVTTRFGTTQALNDEEPMRSDFALTLGMDSQVVEVRPEGFVVETIIVGSEVEANNAQVRDNLAAFYRFLEGVTTYALVGPSGQILAEDNTQLLQFVEASGLEPDVSYGDTITPFPAEPVGIGARWSAITSISAELLEFVQTTTYELVERDEDVVTLALTIEQKLLNPDALAAGVNDADVEYVGLGQATIVRDLRELAPIDSSSSLLQTIGIVGSSAGEPLRYSTINEIGLEIASR